MSKNDSQDFFQPVLSTLGLLSSVLATLIPLFPVDAVTNLFINKELIQVVSASTFLLGFIIVWLILEQQILFIHVPVYLKTLRRKSDIEDLDPLFYFTSSKLVWLLVAMDILLLGLFISLGQSHAFYVGIFQAIVYVFFFIFLITSFSMIFLLSKGKHHFESQKMNFPRAVFDLLERHGHLRNSLEIEEVVQVTPEELKRNNITGFHPLLKKVSVKVLNQTEKKLECFISNDNKEIVKIVQVP